jgi:hypothetical protein
VVIPVPPTQSEVDIPMADIHHDNKAGQLEERSTFMGLDANRLTRCVRACVHVCVCVYCIVTMEVVGGHGGQG